MIRMWFDVYTMSVCIYYDLLSMITFMDEKIITSFIFILKNRPLPGFEPGSSR